jgi:DNA/RNA endonuclease G (NUC1)
MARTLSKKLIKIISFGLFGFVLSSNTYAFNPGGFVEDILSSKAGGKVVDDTEGKDIEPFQKDNQCPTIYPWGAPRVKDKEVNKRSLWLCNVSFSVQVDSKLKIPLWSVETLEKINFEVPPYKNTAKLTLDDRLPKKFQMNPEDFLGTPYLPIPLAPVRDMVINRDKLEQQDLDAINNKAIEESQRLSNTVPMVYNNLANTIWADLETQIRIWAWEKDYVYVNTGVIYLNGNSRGKLNKSGTPIPTHFYKTLVHPPTYGAVSFIIPNQEILTEKTKKLDDPKNAYTCNGGPCNIFNFIVPIQEVEKLTGIEFYPRIAPTYAAKVKLDINEMFKEKKRKQEKQNIR